MKEEGKQREMFFNHTTTHSSTLSPKPESHGYYALIVLVLLILIGCAAAVVVHIKRRSRHYRLDDLRHRLIPLYTYDPAEGEWGDSDKENEEAELAEPLYKEAKLSLFVYGT